jgi:hypothetical protein
VVVGIDRHPLFINPTTANLMAEEEKDPQELTDEELDALLSTKQQIIQRLPTVISVGKRTYKVKQVSKWIATRIHSLELEAYSLSGKQKEPMKLKQAQAIAHKLDTLHAKTAAYYLLNNKALFIPGLFWLTWRRLMLQDEEDCYRINEAGGWNKEINFSLANWEISKSRLAYSMKPVGDGVRQTLKRWAIAEQQAEEDATKKSEADNK